MVRCLLALLVAAAVISGPNWNDPRFISVRDGINNNPASTWKAAIHTNIPYDNEEALRRMCGSTMDADLLRQNSLNSKASGSQTSDAAAEKPGSRRLQSIPSGYDLRQAYPSCWSVSYIRNQGNCGSCWAVSAASALSDRYCIQSTQKGAPAQREFSAEDTIECCSAATCGTGPYQGCNGGYIHGGYAFAATVGSVTGENYGNYTTCKPLSMVYFTGSSEAVAPACSQSCANPVLYPTPYLNDKKTIKGYNYLEATATVSVVTLAQQTIIARGSITAGMDVYVDLYYYQSGVYQRQLSAYYLGGHAIRIIGWGVSSTGLPYWIVANSWGNYWGMNGFFYILKGSNHCRIETFMVEGLLN